MSWSQELSSIAEVLLPMLRQTKDWPIRNEVAAYIDKCIAKGFCKTDDDMRLCAQRFLSGKRKVTPPGTKRRKVLLKEQAKLRASIPSEVVQAVETVIQNNPKAVSHYLAGNDKAIGALIGQVIKLYKFDPVIIADLLKERIK